MMNLKAFMVLAQAGTAAPTPDAGGQLAQNPQAEMIKMVAMIAIFGGMMYFLMIRPQQKKAKEHEAMLKTLKAGDKVITTSGIVGVVIAVKDNAVSLRSADTKLEVLKSAIATVTSGDSSAS